MIKTNDIKAGEFLTLARSIPIIDVRAPKEFTAGHIPGATNIPIFTDEERAIVGTIYKRKGKDAAVLEGLRIVGPKLAAFVEQVGELSTEKKVLVHCWRGGMRSQSFAWLLRTAGFQVQVLKGGYKSYRKFIRQDIISPRKIVILGGMTGSGKTDVLKELIKAGEQVIDLEDLANHRGSAFGAVQGKPQPTNEQFENDVYHAWNSFDPEKTIWIENESQSVGRVWITDEFFHVMRSAPVIALQVQLESRIDRLVKEYTLEDRELLKTTCEKIKKKLGGDNLKKALKSIDENNLSEAARILLAYYDKTYQYGVAKRDPALTINVPCDDGNSKTNALKALTALKNEIRF